ncbi:hypothetical protein BCR34DRAFT_274194, partial [Clohesyomyces aquaticus]
IALHIQSSEITSEIQTLTSYYECLAERQAYLADQLTGNLDIARVFPSLEPSPDVLWTLVQDFVANSILDESSGVTSLDGANAKIISWIASPSLGILRNAGFCIKPALLPTWDSIIPKSSTNECWSVSTLSNGQPYFLDISVSQPSVSMSSTRMSIAESWTSDEFQIKIRVTQGYSCCLQLTDGLSGTQEHFTSYSWKLRWRDEIGTLWGFYYAESGISCIEISDSDRQEARWSFEKLECDAPSQRSKSRVEICERLCSRLPPLYPFTWAAPLKSDNAAIFFTSPLEGINSLGDLPLGNILACYFSAFDVYQALFQHLPPSLTAIQSTRLHFSFATFKYIPTPTGDVAIHHIVIPLPMHDLLDVQSSVSICGMQVGFRDVKVVVEVPGTEHARLLLQLSTVVTVGDMEVVIDFEIELIGSNVGAIGVKIAGCVGLWDLISLFPNAAFGSLNMPFASNENQNAQSLNGKANDAGEASDDERGLWNSPECLSQPIDDASPIIEPNVVRPTSMTFHDIEIYAPNAELSADQGGLRLSANAFWDEWRAKFPLEEGWTIEPVQISFSPGAKAAAKSSPPTPELEVWIKTTFDFSEPIVSWGHDPEAGPLEEHDILADFLVDSNEVFRDAMVFWGTDPVAGPYEEQDPTFELDEDLSDQPREFHDLTGTMHEHSKNMSPSGPLLEFALHARQEQPGTNFQFDCGVLRRGHGKVPISQVLKTIPFPDVLSNISAAIDGISIPGLDRLDGLYFRRFSAPLVPSGSGMKLIVWELETEAPSLLLLPGISVENVILEFSQSSWLFAFTGKGCARLRRLDKPIEISFVLPTDNEGGSFKMTAPLGLSLSDLLSVFNAFPDGNNTFLGKLLDIEVLMITGELEWESASNSAIATEVACTLRPKDDLKIGPLTLHQVNATFSFKAEGCAHGNRTCYTISASASVLGNELSISLDWNSCQDSIGFHIFPSGKLELTSIVGLFNENLKIPPIPLLDQLSFRDGNVAVLGSSLAVASLDLNFSLGDTLVTWQRQDSTTHLNFSPSASLTFLDLARQLLDTSVPVSTLRFLDGLLLDTGKLTISEDLTWSIPSIRFQGPRLNLSVNMSPMGECTLNIEGLQDIHCLDILADVLPNHISSLPSLVSELNFQHGCILLQRAGPEIDFRGFTAQLASSRLQATVEWNNDIIKIHVLPRIDLTSANILELIHPGLRAANLPILKDLRFVSGSLKLRISSNECRVFEWSLRLASLHLDVTLSANLAARSILLEINPTTKPYGLNKMLSSILPASTYLSLESFAERFNVGITYVRACLSFDDNCIELQSFDIGISDESSLNFNGLRIRTPRIKFSSDIGESLPHGETLVAPIDTARSEHAGEAISSMESPASKKLSLLLDGLLDIGGEAAVTSISFPLDISSTPSLAFSLHPPPDRILTAKAICSLINIAQDSLPQPKSFKLPSELNIERVEGYISFDDQSNIQIDSFSAAVRLDINLPLLDRPKIELANPRLVLQYAAQRDLAYQLFAQLVLGNANLALVYSRDDDGGDFFTCEPSVERSTVSFELHPLLDAFGLDVASYELPSSTIDGPKLQFDTLKLNLREHGCPKLTASGPTSWNLAIGGIDLHLERLTTNLDFISPTATTPLSLDCNISLSGDLSFGGITAGAIISLEAGRKLRLTAHMEKSGIGPDTIDLEAVLSGAGKIGTEGESMLPDSLKRFSAEVLSLDLTADFQDESFYLNGTFGRLGSGFFRRVPYSSGGHQSVIALATKDISALWGEVGANIKAVAGEVEVAVVILSHTMKYPFLPGLLASGSDNEVPMAYRGMLYHLQKKVQAQQLTYVGPGAMIHAKIDLTNLPSTSTTSPLSALASAVDISPDAMVTLFATISEPPQDSVVELSFRGLKLLGGSITLRGTGQYAFKDEKFLAQAFVKIGHEVLQDPLNFRVDLKIEDGNMSFESPENSAFEEPVIAPFKVMKGFEISKIRFSGKIATGAVQKALSDSNPLAPQSAPLGPATSLFVLQGEARLGKYVASGSILLPNGVPKAVVVSFPPDARVPITQWIGQAFGVLKTDLPKIELAGLTVSCCLPGEEFNYPEKDIVFRPGYRAQANISLFDKIFSTEIAISEDAQGFELTGKCEEQIDLGVIQLTFNEHATARGSTSLGPVFTLSKTNSGLDCTLQSGLTLFGHPSFSLRLSYKNGRFIGTAIYSGSVFGIQNPKLSLNFSESGEYGTNDDFAVFQDLPGKDLAEGIKKASTKDKGCKCGQLELPLDGAECNVKFALRLPFANHRISKAEFKVVAKVSLGISIGKFRTTIELGEMEIPLPIPMDRDSLPTALKDTAKKNVEKMGAELLKQKRKFAGLVGALIAKGLSKKTTEQLVCRKVKSKELVKQVLNTSLTVASMAGGATAAAVGAALSIGTGTLGAATGIVGTAFTTYLMASLAVSAITTPVGVATGAAGLGIKMGWLLTAPVRKVGKVAAGAVFGGDDDGNSDSDGEDDGFAAAREEMRALYTQREKEIAEYHRQQQAALAEVKKKIEAALVLSAPPELELIEDEEKHTCSMHLDWSSVLPKVEGFDFGDYQGFEWMVEVGANEHMPGSIAAAALSKTSWTLVLDAVLVRERTFHARVRAKFTAKQDAASEEFVARAWTAVTATRVPRIPAPTDVQIVLNSDLEHLELNCTDEDGRATTHRWDIAARAADDKTGATREVIVWAGTSETPTVKTPLLDLGLTEPCELFARVRAIANSTTPEADSFPTTSPESLKVENFKLRTQATLLGEDLTLTCIASEPVEGEVYACRDSPRIWTSLGAFANDISILFLDSETRESESSLYLVPHPDPEKRVIYLPYLFKLDHIVPGLPAPTLIPARTFLSLEEDRLHIALELERMETEHGRVKYFVVESRQPHGFLKGVPDFRATLLGSETGKFTVTLGIDIPAPRPASVNIRAVIVNDHGEHIHGERSAEISIAGPANDIDAMIPIHAFLMADGTLRISWPTEASAITTQSSSSSWTHMRITIFDSAGFSLHNTTIPFPPGKEDIGKEVTAHTKGQTLLIRAFPTTSSIHGKLAFRSFHIPEGWTTTSTQAIEPALPGEGSGYAVGKNARFVKMVTPRGNPKDMDNVYTRVFYTTDDGHLVHVYRKHRPKTAVSTSVDKKTKHRSTETWTVWKHEKWQKDHLRHSRNAVSGGSDIALITLSSGGRDKAREKAKDAVLLVWITPSGRLEYEISRNSGKDFEKLKLDKDKVWNRDGIASTRGGGCVTGLRIGNGIVYVFWLGPKGAVWCAYALEGELHFVIEKVVGDGSVSVGAGVGGGEDEQVGRLVCWEWNGRAAVAFIASDGKIMLAEGSAGPGSGSGSADNRDASAISATSHAPWPIHALTPPGAANPQTALAAFDLQPQTAANVPAHPQILVFGNPDGALATLFYSPSDKNPEKWTWTSIGEISHPGTLHPRSDILVRRKSVHTSAPDNPVHQYELQIWYRARDEGLRRVSAVVEGDSDMEAQRWVWSEMEILPGLDEGVRERMDGRGKMRGLGIEEVGGETWVLAQRGDGRVEGVGVD